MASSLQLKPQYSTLLTLLIISFIPICCNSEQDAVDDVAKAMACFNNQYAYSTCEESYRLKQQGSILVPPEAVNEYCGGPCLRETNLMLQCLLNTFSNFRFYNGATLLDIRSALDRGCGLGADRGDFSLPGLNGGGKKIVLSIYLLVMWVCIWLSFGV